MHALLAQKLQCLVHVFQAVDAHFSFRRARLQNENKVYLFVRLSDVRKN